ncbi:MAG: arginine decarboxylase [Halobacteriovoraceae bacterium]|nr:arginine decarboxylase [Halobacteriovoraceae bacterium]|tara:strand:- start:7625 stop:9535 length:1911 start_codon:yes stop_codon:yes gene_type:complete
MNKSWNIEDSINTYQIKRWGLGYFGINNDGDMCVYPEKTPDGPSINIKEVIEELKEEDIQFPVVLRFHDILRAQVTDLNETFNSTIKQAGFRGQYYGVYPIKVNQLREVVEEIVDVGEKYNYGLEAGSKPELLAVLAYNQTPNALTILNGYKDKEYMELAMLGTQMGRKIVIVIEKLSEIYTVLEMAKKHHCEPLLGVRAKLATQAGGKWSESSGEFAKFGLPSSEILDLIEILKEKNKLHWLKLLHFHVGSQIPDIRNIKECITEGARIYCDLQKMGVDLEYFDAGGGVGVNYDGTNSNSPTSINYKLSDYIGDVVYILKDLCDMNEVPHPHIVTETGRAISAHHSCVITKVFGNVNLTKHKSISTEVEASDHMLLKNIKELYKDLNANNYQDIYNDACTIKDEVVYAYKLGVINLKDRAVVETLYWNICHQILNMTKDEKYVPVEIQKLKSILADKYLCNFSLFQSAPDSWAINQILPIVPISCHDQEPTNECTLCDITCDSDGKVNDFLGAQGNKSTLPIHPLPEHDDYYVGLFLTGAYQDVMGDMHNMFGRLNEAHIYCDDDDPTDFYIEEMIPGNSAANVLEIMQYNSSELFRKVKTQIDNRIKQGDIKPRVGVKLADFYEKCLKSYTYLK